MRRQIWKESVRFLCVLLGILSSSALLHAKAWQSGFIAELRPDGFVLQTRFYPHIVVHTTGTTLVHCKKHSLPLSDLQLHDLVTVEGAYKRDGSTDAIPRSLSTASGGIVRVPRPKNRLIVSADNDFVALVTGDNSGIGLRFQFCVSAILNVPTGGRK